MAATLPIALAGIGKIARDQHIPAISAGSDWHLAATISRNAQVEGVRGVPDMATFLADPQGIETVSLALPPGPRLDYAVAAIEAGMNVMLEKPPGRTLAECRWLVELAQQHGVSLFASWHSRMGAAVAETARHLRGQTLRKLAITWCEDVREWHPGQDWVFEAGNLGVFDPGINAMSILVALLEAPVRVESAHMIVPGNGETPIAANLTFGHPSDAEMSCWLDWRHQGAAQWDIEIETEDHKMLLRGSGAHLEVDGAPVPVPAQEEYPALYQRFGALVRSGESDVDLRPMELVADAFLVATHENTTDFHF